MFFFSSCDCVVAGRIVQFILRETGSFELITQYMIKLYIAYSLYCLGMRSCTRSLPRNKMAMILLTLYCKRLRSQDLGRVVEQERDCSGVYRHIRAYFSSGYIFRPRDTRSKVPCNTVNNELLFRSGYPD